MITETELDDLEWCLSSLRCFVTVNANDYNVKITRDYRYEIDKAYQILNRLKIELKIHE